MSKRILVFGGSGMLGKRVVAALRSAGNMVAAPSHSSVPIFDFIRVDMALAGNSFSAVDRPPGAPDLIINCAGAIAGRHYRDEDMIEINAAGPHVIARAAQQRGGIPIIHISTDCVFSGIPDARKPGRRFSASERGFPRDLYGRSKALGEVEAPHVTNVRTSFIGPEHGLWAWLASEDARVSVQGWQRAFWTGSTAEAVAAAIVAMADDPPGGVVHLATREKLSKYEVLVMLRDHLGLTVEIEAVQYPQIDRALAPDVVLPSLAEALAVAAVERAMMHGVAL